MAENEGMILDLSTLAPQRQTIFIRSTVHPDGQHYGLRSVEEMSLIDQQRLFEYTTQAEGLADRQSLTHEEAIMLTNLLNDVVRATLIDIEDAVVSEMTDWQKAQIARAFTNASRLTNQSSLGATAEGQPTGES